ncbi:MAG: 2-amino-4-hydroxy-6-hydroxymethyldihydropteridine diphosphokinase [Spirochaetales bacterium]|nr:2-amino-4-hydroxy-6-hydroxymethyldihydropteridine diphosphokinase [Spirochaetales bacterium]
MPRAILSLGSNLGDREGYLGRACQELSLAGLLLLRRTAIKNTKALIKEDQPDFLNQLLLIETDLGAPALLMLLKALEKKIGRKKRERYGPREIDLDILTYENLQLSTPYLTLPHPGLKDRPYLKELMTELTLSERT